MDKKYISGRVMYWLNKAIETETEFLKEDIKNNPKSDTNDACTALGVLVALKIEAKDLIEKL